MKELLELTGGYKRHISYLLKLQSEVIGVHNALFKNLGHDLALSGCEVTDNGNGTVNISSGVVYVDGEIIRFQGANNVPSDGSKALVKGNPVTSDPKEFLDNTIKNVYKETFAVIADTTNSIVQIVVKTPSLYSIKDYISDIIQSYGQKGETKFIIDIDGNFLQNFDSSGLGTTARFLNWALMNGNNGAPNMAGRTPIGVGSFVDAYGLQHNYSNNQEGGQPRHILSINEMPSHSHVMPNQITIATAGESRSDAFHRVNSQYTQRNTNSSGGGLPHNNMQPYRAGYWIIKIT